MYCLRAEHGRLRIMLELNVVYYTRSDKLVDEVGWGGGYHPPSVLKQYSFSSSYLYKVQILQLPSCSVAVQEQ
jgi:hypothetical protein